MKPYQFSIRSLLVLTLLVAMLLPLHGTSTIGRGGTWSHVRWGVWHRFRWPHLARCYRIGFVRERTADYLAIWPARSTVIPYAFARTSEGAWLVQNTKGRQTILVEGRT